MNFRVLTGITTTGTPHLGNYVGAIRPAIAASRHRDVDAFFFLADYHALVKCDDPARVARSRLEIAATWLACGLDPARVTFYRQSDIPEIPELTWLLTCVTAKGLLNRAHAYKAAVDQNTAKGEDPDTAINAGLYMYPVLMAADILAFRANRVPVGRDQVQHIEMARDIGQRFNHIYGAAWHAAGGKGEPFMLPEVAIEEHVATLPGLDGRKMSKSYDNTIPLFEGGARATRDAIARIVTDSREPGEAKDPDSSSLFAIYRAFAAPDDAAAFAAALREGLGWGEAKQRLFALVDAGIAPLRDRYDALIVRPGDIEDALQEGAKKARAIAAPFLERLRATVGLGALRSPSPQPLPHRGGGAQSKARSGDIAGFSPLPFVGEGAARSAAGEGAKRSNKRARVASFRDADGFRFRVFAADGEELLLSRAFADPKTAGVVTRALSAPEGAPAIEAVDATRCALLVNGERIAESPVYADATMRDAAIEKLRAALDSLRG